MAFGESRIQIHDFTIFVESDTRTVPMEIEPPVPIQPPTVPEVTQKVTTKPNLKSNASEKDIKLPVAHFTLQSVHMRQEEVTVNSNRQFYIFFKCVALYHSPSQNPITQTKYFLEALESS